MDNKQVRAHLRKGELAVQLLEGMGFRYTDAKAYAMPKWSAPDTFVNMEEARKEMQAVIDKFKPKAVVATPLSERVNRICPVRDGARFVITSLPLGHFLTGSMYRHKCFKMASTEWITEGSQKSEKLNGFSGWVVHFNNDFGSCTQTLWLPLSCIKVTSNADF